MSMTETSSAASATSTAAAASSSAAKATISAGSNLKVVGIILAITSGALIGSSFVFKKKGLLRSQANGVAGEGVAYLKSPLWWAGMIMMIIGELCNFAAYAFVEAIVVTPLGALSVVISAVLSSIFLKETLTFFGWLGCGLCLLGSVIIALNGPESPSVGQITEFQKLFLSPGFGAWAGCLILASIIIIVFFVPKYGKQSMLWYIFVCSMIGGISVSVTSGLGAAIVTTAYGDNQFKHWFIYFLLAFIVATLVTEVYYLNVALALFNTAMVTPTYYVIFTFFSIVTTIILFQGLEAPVRQIITLVMGFLVICFGIVILQMSKIDPVSLNKLDRRSTLLLQAARAKTEGLEEKSFLGAEDPGMDTLRGSFGAVGSIIRMRSARRLSQASSSYRVRHVGGGGGGSTIIGSPYSRASSQLPQPSHTEGGDPLAGMKRHQLYDAPMPPQDTPHPPSIDINSTSSVMGSPSQAKRPTIKFGGEDVVHQYDRPGTGDRMTEHRRVAASPLGEGYPPLPNLPPSRTDGLPVGGGGGVHGRVLFPVRSMESLSPVPEGGSLASGSATPSGSGTTVRGSGVVGTLIGNLDPAENSPQTLLLDGGFTREKRVQSAPSSSTGFGSSSTSSKRVAGGGGGDRSDARALFDQVGQPSPAPSAAGTLLTFPSVTDSGRSDDDMLWEIDDESERLRKGRAQRTSGSLHGSPKGSERATSAKRYPRSSGEDDREESRSLWRRSGTDEEASDDQTSPGSPSLSGGIRLVTSTPNTTF